MPKKVEERISLSLSSDYLAAIGLVATHWAGFEFLLDAAIWVLAGIDHVDYGACMTAQIANSGRKLDAIIALSARRGCAENILKQLRSLAGKTGGLQRRRNRIVHDAWMVDAKSRTHYRLEVTAAKELSFEMKAVSLDEVRQYSQEIIAHTVAFLELTEKVLKDPSVAASREKTSPEILPPQTSPAPQRLRSPKRGRGRNKPRPPPQSSPE
jgi:hypothetical protein